MKKEKPFVVRYFNWMGDDIGWIFLFFLLPLLILVFSICYHYQAFTFWLKIGIPTIILAEIIYFQYAKYKEGADGYDLFGLKLMSIGLALQTVAFYIILPYYVIKIIPKIPYETIWKPLLMLVGVIGLIVSYFVINIWIGKKIGGKK